MTVKCTNAVQIMLFTESMRMSWWLRELHTNWRLSDDWRVHTEQKSVSCKRLVFSYWSLGIWVMPLRVAVCLNNTYRVLM